MGKEHNRTKEELERVYLENAHLNAQVSAMSVEQNRKTEEIRKHQAEQTVVFKRIRELVGQPAEAIVKAWMFDGLIKSADPTQALIKLVQYPPREIHTTDEQALRGRPTIGSAWRNPEAGIVPRATRISYRNPLRGGGQSASCPQSASGCRAWGGVQTRKHREATGEDPLLSAEEEDHRVREIRKGSVPSPLESQPVPDTRLIPNSGSAT